MAEEEEVEDGATWTGTNVFIQILFSKRKFKIHSIFS